jgi:hypothetical protein
MGTPPAINQGRPTESELSAIWAELIKLRSNRFSTSNIKSAVAKLASLLSPVRMRSTAKTSSAGATRQSIRHALHEESRPAISLAVRAKQRPQRKGNSCAPPGQENPARKS